MEYFRKSRKDTTGERRTGDLRYIDQHILKETKTSRKNVAMAWIVFYTHIINMHIYTYTDRIHIGTIIKMSEDFFKKIYLSLYLKELCV